MKNQVREFRNQMNWTQSDLAERLDVSRQTIHAIERQKYDPSLPLAFRIARLFGVSVEEVFQDEGADENDSGGPVTGGK